MHPFIEAAAGLELGCEVSTFAGRDPDDWYYLEWWPTIRSRDLSVAGIWVVYQAPKESVVSTDVWR